jgi:hypothetical protein
MDDHLHAERLDIGRGGLAVVRRAVEALVVHRNLLLLNDVVVTTNVEHRQVIAPSARNTFFKIGGWFGPGIFRPEVGSLVSCDWWIFRGGCRLPAAATTAVRIGGS